MASVEKTFVFCLFLFFFVVFFGKFDIFWLPITDKTSVWTQFICNIGDYSSNVSEKKTFVKICPMR